MRTHCLQCGRPIPFYSKDYKYSDGTTLHRAGRFRGSNWMLVADKNRNFCKLECAARYGVRCADAGVKL